LKKLNLRFVGIRSSAAAIVGHPLEPKIAVGSHHILIVSDRPASPTLLQGYSIAAIEKIELPSYQSIAKFLPANGVNASNLAR
jgi:hypothetical protein